MHGKCTRYMGLRVLRFGFRAQDLGLRLGFRGLGLRV